MARHPSPGACPTADAVPAATRAGADLLPVPDLRHHSVADRCNLQRHTALDPEGLDPRRCYLPVRITAASQSSSMSTAIPPPEAVEAECDGAVRTPSVIQDTRG
jgi:hypothetical protein